MQREELAEAPEADLRQRQVPRTLTLRGSGRALRNGIDGGMARVNLRGQPGQPFANPGCFATAIPLALLPPAYAAVEAD